MAQLPTSPNFKGYSLRSNHKTVVDEAQSGRTNVRQVGGHTWDFTAQYPIMTQADFMPIYAFLQARQGAFENFTVLLSDKATARGALGGTPIVAADHVTNGDFSVGTGWVLGAGWSIAAGVANCDGTQGGNTELRQALSSYIVQSSVTVTYTVSNLSAGTVQLFLDGTGATGLTRTGNGTYTETLSFPSDSTGIVFLRGNSDFVGDIDDISLTLSNTSTILRISGASNSITNWLRSGDIMTIAGDTKVYLSTSDVNSESNGFVYLDVSPGLFIVPTDGALVTFTNVLFTVISLTSVQEYSVSPPNLYQYNVDFKEFVA